MSGVRIDSVHYTVTQHTPTNLIREGTLPTLGSGAAFAVGLELPRGSSYRLNLSGVSVEGGTFLSCTGSVGPFSIAPGITPFLELDLTCVNNTSGSLSPGLAIETDACPQVDISQVTALPAIAEVSSTIELVVVAQDTQGRNLSYTWSLENPSLGSFQDVALSHARLTCLALAEGALVTVSASNGQCSTSALVQISCVAP